MTTRARALDWSKHRTGKPQACRCCGGPTILRDVDGCPCHKVCAELELDDAATRATSSRPRRSSR